MEFHEKLQELRKRRGLTQEELAQALYVSRTAISKWEQGRGYPSIDSLKEISGYFSVTIDELLSGEKLISLAEKENRSNIRSVCDMLLGVTDLLSFVLIILPLYPQTADGVVYSVNLWMYTETAAYNRTVYWMLFLALTACGVWKLLQTQLNPEKDGGVVTRLSFFIGAAAVLYLVLAREAYASVLVILLMSIKVLLAFKIVKSGR